LAQQRKLEKLQKEKAALENMSPEAQRKWEEKQAKKEAKKKQNKMKVVMRA
jgi:fructoselysine-6-P-deglycase FrlB-like protein